MRFVIWHFIKFLFRRSSLNAFTVTIWLEQFMDAKTKRSVADCFRRMAEDMGE